MGFVQVVNSRHTNPFDRYSQIACVKMDKSHDTLRLLAVPSKSVKQPALATHSERREFGSLA